MKDLPTSVLNSRLTLLSEEKCQAIYDAALTIIAEIGMTVPHAVARELLVGAGATVEGDDLVRIPRELVAKARETVPSMIRSTTATASWPCSSAATTPSSGPAPTS